MSSDLFFDYNKTPEEIFQISLIDKKHGVKVKVEIHDENDEVYSLSEISENLVKYVQKELSKEQTVIISQIYPLMSQLLVNVLSRTIGVEPTAFVLGNELTKVAALDVMVFSFLLLKYIQQKNLKIVTITEELSEVEKQYLASKESSVYSRPTFSGMIGMRPKDILQALYSDGELTIEDLKDVLEKRDSYDSKDASTTN